MHILYKSGKSTSFQLVEVGKGTYDPERAWLSKGPKLQSYDMDVDYAFQGNIKSCMFRFVRFPVEWILMDVLITRLYTCVLKLVQTQKQKSKTFQLTSP